MTSDTTNYRNSFSLDGKVALVTGAAGTLGAEICRGLVSVGASVLITDIQEETGRAVRDELLAAGAKAEFIKHNVVDEGEWEAAIKCAVDTFGGLDIVVDPYTSSTSGTVRIVALQTCDVAVRHAVSFAFNNDGA